MRYFNCAFTLLRRVGVAAALSGTLLAVSPAIARADAPLVPDAASDLQLSQSAPAAVQPEGRSAIELAAETTKHFSEISPYVDSIGEKSVSIENIVAEQERQKTKEIELARVEAGVKAAQEERARIAEEERKAAEAAAARQALVDEALSHVGTPYVSGGAAPGGFDCSGLVKYCVAQVYGHDMPRTAAAQSGEGESVSFGDLQTGDLLFWGSGSGVYHVAIYVGNGQYVHAPRPGQSVKVQTLESYTPTFAKRLNL